MFSVPEELWRKWDAAIISASRKKAKRAWLSQQRALKQAGETSGPVRTGTILGQLRTHGYGMMASDELSIILDTVLNRQQNGVSAGIRTILNNLYTGQAYRCVTSTHDYSVDATSFSLMGYTQPVPAAETLLDLMSKVKDDGLFDR